MNRLGTFRVLDQRFTVRASERLAAVVVEALGDLRVADERGSAAHDLTIRRRLRGWEVRWDGEVRWTGATDAGALHHALVVLNSAVGEMAVDQGHLVLHGTCLLIDGAAVIVSGHAGVGKSALTVTAMRAGHGLVAEAVCAISSDHWVHPNHRPLAIHAESALEADISIPAGPFTLTYPVRASRVGMTSGPAPLALVVMFDSRSANQTAEPLSPAHSLVRLANEAMSAPHLASESFRRLEHLCRTVPMFEMSPIGADAACRELVRLVRERCR